MDSGSALRRIRLHVEYDGTRYAGWQRQLGVHTVQQEIEDALGRMFGALRIVIHGASRTDAGVHAVGQVAHFDCQGNIPAEKIAFALNSMLPEDIRIQASMEAVEGFHARFHATGKIYQYAIWNRRHASAMHRLTHAHVPTPLNVSLMQQEVSAILGRHDFAAFEAAGGRMKALKRTARTMHRAEITQEDARICLCIHGNAFLFNMVRIIAGTLIDVGRGRVAPGALARALISGDRLQLGITAPAQGLTLLRVFYGDDEQAAEIFENPDYAYNATVPPQGRSGSD